jgi:hypothetical protein
MSYVSFTFTKDSFGMLYKNSVCSISHNKAGYVFLLEASNQDIFIFIVMRYTDIGPLVFFF